jgi:hypothetical protein
LDGDVNPERSTVNVNGLNRATTYQYWPNGFLKTRQLPNGKLVGDYAYDVAGRLNYGDSAYKFFCTTAR